MIEVGSAEGMEHFMAEDSDAAAGKKIRKLEIEIVDPFAVDVDIPVVDRPAMRPEQFGPAVRGALDDEANVIHHPIVVAVQSQAGRDLRTDSVHGVHQ